MGATASCCCAWCDRDHADQSLYEPLLQENEREAVADLLQFLENRTDTILLEGEPLRALTTLSYSNNVDLQRSAALAFAEITERHVHEVDTPVLEPLLYLLKDNNDMEVQRAASAALGNLAVNVSNKIRIVQCGGLEPLVKQMLSSNVEVQCNAVGCITNLATHEENKTAIARSGALIPLTRLARQTRDIRVQRNSTGALLNMTHSEENRRELVDAGAIPVLVGLLKSADVDVVYYCTTALSNLAVDASNRKKLAQESRLVGELVDLMESPSFKVQCQAALALRNLASDELYQLEIARHSQGLSRLLTLLQGKPVSAATIATSNGTATAAPPNSQLILAAVACIRNISIHPQNENLIIEAGFLTPLVELLDHENEEIQCHAISTLRNLAAGTGNVEGSSMDNKEKIVASGALDKIRQLIERGAPSSRTGQPTIGWAVLSEMTACLAVLALSDKLKPRLLQSGMVKTLLPLTRANVPSDVQGNAAAAIGNLATKVPDLSLFLAEWDTICSYLERFLEPQQQHADSPVEDESAATFQHIAIWTILQFAEKGEPIRTRLLDRTRMLQLVQELESVNHDEEVELLTTRVLTHLGLERLGTVRR